MSLTNTTVFTLTRDDVLNASARATGYLGQGETLSPDDKINRSQALNIMIKFWATSGMALWVTNQIVMPLVAGLYSYPIGPTAGYVYSISASGGSGYSAGGTWTATNGTTGTAASGTYTVSDGQIDAMTILVAGTAYTSAPTTFTLSGPGSAAVITATIVGLTTHKPLKFVDNTFVRKPDGSDTPLRQLARSDYNIRSPKGVAGVPVDFYYEPGIENGTITFTQVPTDTTYYLYGQVQRYFMDMVAGSDNFDFPPEWLLVLKWNLAAEMALEDGVSLDKLAYIETKAASSLAASFNFSVEEATTYFTADTQGRG